MYIFQEFLYNSYSYAVAYTVEELMKPSFETEQVETMMLNINSSRSQIIFSAITISPGNCRLAILAHDGSDSILPDRRIRYLVQNITVGTFPTDHVTDQLFLHNYEQPLKERANPNIAYKSYIKGEDIIPGYNENIVLVVSGILASDYTGFDAAEGLPTQFMLTQTVRLNGSYDVYAAIMTLDFLGTIIVSCYGKCSIQLAHIFRRKVFTTVVMFSIVFPMILAFISFLMTQKSRNTIFFADLPDAIAAVTNGNNTLIVPNSHYIKLVFF